MIKTLFIKKKIISKIKTNFSKIKAQTNQINSKLKIIKIIAIKNRINIKQIKIKISKIKNFNLLILTFNIKIALTKIKKFLIFNFRKRMNHHI